MINNKYSFGNEIKYDIVEQSSINKKIIEDFSCGNEDIDKAIKNPNSNYKYKYFIDTELCKIIGFVAYCTSGIQFHYGKDIVTKSALEIGYFALDEYYQHIPYDKKDSKNFKLSDFLFCEMLAMFRTLSDTTIPFEYIKLFSVKKAVKFYKRNYFEEFNEFEHKSYITYDKHNYIDGCTPMFLTL